MKEHDIRLDLVRSFAIFAVLIVHSFGFNELSAPQDFIRLIGLTGVPLFLILTGWLNQEKTLDDYYQKRKWKSCARVLFAYLFLGSICFVIDRMCYPEHALSAKAWLLELLQFKLTPYGWYIEMWIGLFFLTPILNIIIKGIKGVNNDRYEKQILLTLVLLSSLPAFFNRNDNNIIPNFWVLLYPIALYFIGAWLSHHTIRMKSYVLLFGSFCILCIEPLCNELLMGGGKYIYFLGGQNDIAFLILAIAFFTLLTRVRITSRRIYRVISLISKISLYMYLISYAFDTIFKHYYMPPVTGNVIDRFPWHVLMLMFSFSLSFIAGLLYMLFEKHVLKRINKYL